MEPCTIDIPPFWEPPIYSWIRKNPIEIHSNKKPMFISHFSSTKWWFSTSILLTYEPIDVARITLGLTTTAVGHTAPVVPWIKIYLLSVARNGGEKPVENWGLKTGGKTVVSP